MDGRRIIAVCALGVVAVVMPWAGGGGHGLVVHAESTQRHDGIRHANAHVRDVQSEIGALLAASRSPSKAQAAVELKAWASSATSPTTPTVADVVRASSVFQPRTAAHSFHGSCTQFRSTLWGVAQRTSDLMVAYYSSLSKDYGQYPVPNGGSTPGATQDQFNSALSDSIAAQLLLLDVWGSKGLMFDNARIAASYGVTQPWQKGPYNWAVWQIYLTQQLLYNAASGETIGTNFGEQPLGEAAQNTQYMWDALKQLPC